MIRTGLCLLLWSAIAISAAGQSDSLPRLRYFGAGVTATNNGISLLPSFSLGKPAVIFDMQAGGKRLSFEPQLRFAMEGKPWSFIFWWRYKVIKSSRFYLNIGAHPAIVFKTYPAGTNGFTVDTQVGQRYFATEVSPNYWISKTTTVGIYYLHSNGLDEGTTRSTHFLTVNANFTRIPLGGPFIAKFNPQLYYINQDGSDGYYATTSLTLARDKFPLSVQSIVNIPLVTNISAALTTIWNASLIYSFRKEYAEK